MHCGCLQTDIINYCSIVWDQEYTIMAGEKDRNPMYPEYLQDYKLVASVDGFQTIKFVLGKSLNLSGHVF